MRNKIKASLSFLLLVSRITVIAQTGELSGKLREANGDGVNKGTVILYDNTGNQLKAVITDFDGNFTIPKLADGIYNLSFSAVNCISSSTNGLIVKADRCTFVADVYLMYEPSYNPQSPKRKKKKGKL